MIPAKLRPRAARLGDLLDGLPPQLAAIGITALSLDSRKLTPGSLFVALPGSAGHGLDYLQEAVAAGCAAVAAEVDAKWNSERVAALRAGIPVIAADKLFPGAMAARFYGDPSSELTIFGYTGTNGKTTCAWLTAEALENCAMIGTLGNGVPGRLHPATHTTPDAITLQKMFADYLQAGISAVAMEVSSHALEQQRVDGVDIDVAVFTNISRDHLDYHATMHSYGEAKQRLFRHPGLKCAVINMDDPYGEVIADSLGDGVRPLKVGVDAPDVALRALQVEQTQQGLRMVLRYGEQQARLASPLIGRFNVDNLLCVAGALLAAGVPLVQAVRRLTGLAGAPGRMERFGGGQQPLVVVDYAHTPDALENALRAARAHAAGELTCLFGCGGDRDRGKRPIMGGIAEQFADHVILTDDNPRSEDGDEIIEQILHGMQHPARVVRNRREAITLAIAQARPGDLVLVAGKGHEEQQVSAERSVHFSDREEVARILEELQ
jgi:UDP-N-acetylmuramoyl-L-alanyl-D-glutamate--2,6-diaminopimelate ligase